MKAIRLNGFNKRIYTLEEVKEILESIGIKVFIDPEFSFDRYGKHFADMKTIPKKLKKKKKK